jgi:Spx/MgsR family transcriptional regulator
MLIYGLKNCDTCRKALKALVAAGHEVLLVDIRAEPLSREMLAAFEAAFGAALLNTRSTTWRNLSEDARKGTLVDLITAHPALMKRPVIRAKDGTLYLGWGDAVQAALS